MALTSPWYFPLNRSLADMRRIQVISNHWDRDVALKQALGVGPDVFARSAQLLKLTR